MPNSKTYEVSGYHCDNCDWSGSISVGCGELRPDVATCPNCKCKTAKHKPSPPYVPVPYPVPYPRPYREPRPWSLLPGDGTVPDTGRVIWSSSPETTCVNSTN